METISYIDHKYYMDNDMIIRRISHAKPVEPHTHDFMEFVYMFSGHSLHTVNGIQYPLDSGDLLIVNYGEIHHFTANPEARFCNILIKPALIDKSLSECKDLFSLFETAPFRDFKALVNDQCRAVRFSPEEKNCFQYLLELLIQEQEKQEVGFALTARAGVHFLLTMIFRRMSNTLLEQTHGFQDVLEYINAHYAESLSAAELAARCHYNPSYFSRVFKRYTALTFSEYLKRLRIAKSCELLLLPQKTTDLYLKVGYTNRTNFYRHFRELTGMTPLEYQKVKK